MMRNPAPPMVEMLLRSSAFVSTTVDLDVISKPSIGRFQAGRSSWAGSFLDSRRCRSFDLIVQGGTDRRCGRKHRGDGDHREPDCSERGQGGFSQRVVTLVVTRVYRGR